MSTESLKIFESICAKIKKSLPPKCELRWDDEFNIVLAVIGKEFENAVYSVIINEFDRHWDFSNIGDSSQSIDKFVSSVFGIVPGQSFFTTREIDELRLFAAWWPWGDNEKFSLRIGMFYTEEEALFKMEIKKCLTQWFNL